MNLMFYAFLLPRTAKKKKKKKSWCTSEGRILIGSHFLPLKPDYFNMAAV